MSESERLKSIDDKMDTVLKGQETLTKILTGAEKPEDGVVYKQVAHDGKLKGIRVELDEIKSKDKQRTGWLMGSVIGIFVNSIFDIFKRGG